MLDFLKGLGIVAAGSSMVLFGCFIQLMLMGLSALVGLWFLSWFVSLFH